MAKLNRELIRLQNENGAVERLGEFIRLNYWPVQAWVTPAGIYGRCVLFLLGLNSDSGRLAGEPGDEERVYHRSILGVEFANPA